MLPKKTSGADLENKRGIFLQIGFIIALGVILAAFEWSSTSGRNQPFEITGESGTEQEIMQITRPEEVKPPPLPKTAVADVLNITANDVDIEDDPFFLDAESTQDMEIDIDPFIEPEEEAEDVLFAIVEDKPMFQGGTVDQFRIWIARNLKYPEIAAENRVSGKVNVQFIINTRGQLVDAKVVKGVDPALDKEAIRVLMSSPAWTPGKQRSKPVRVQYNLTINFVLQ